MRGDSARQHLRSKQGRTVCFRIEPEHKRAAKPKNELDYKQQHFCGKSIIISVNI